MNSGDRNKRLSDFDFQPLIAFLAACPRDEATLTFAEIEQLLGRLLPRVVFTRAWWTRGGTDSSPRPWESAGWVVKSAEPRQRRVTFARQQTHSL
jgi:hypothetical protein